MTSHSGNVKQLSWCQKTDYTPLIDHCCIIKLLYKTNTSSINSDPNCFESWRLGYGSLKRLIVSARLNNSSNSSSSTDKSWCLKSLAVYVCLSWYLSGNLRLEEQSSRPQYSNYPPTWNVLKPFCESLLALAELTWRWPRALRPPCIEKEDIFHFFLNCRA